MRRHAFQLLYLAGRGYNSMVKGLFRGGYSAAKAREIWGFPSIPGLILLGIASLVLSYFLPFGFRFYNPLTMSFPGEAFHMVIALYCSPLMIFALAIGLKWRKKGFPASIPEQDLFFALGVPLFIGGLLLVISLQVWYSWRFLQDGMSPGALLHMLGNAAFLGAWLSFFLATAVVGKGIGAGKILAGFFTFHSILFARSFIPDFGVLDVIANNVIRLDYHNFEPSSILVSSVKMLVCLGVVGVFWFVASEQIAKWQKPSSEPTEEVSSEEANQRNEASIPPPLPPEAS